MASAQGIRAGAAFIELSVNDSKLIKGLQQALTRLKSLGSGLQSIGSGMQALGTRTLAVGAGIVTPLLAAAKSFAEIGDALDKMSARTGISVEALSELGHAAQLSGASMEDVEGAIRRMQRTLAEARSGSKTALEALAALGLTVEDLQALSPDEQFALIGARLNAIQDPAQRAAAAMEVFGRSGTNLLPMLGDLGQLRAEARRLGVVMSTEDAQAAAALNDGLDRLWATLRSLVVTVGSALAPLLAEWAGRMQELVASARNWLSQNQGLVTSILQLGVSLLGIGAALTALGGTLSALSTAFGAFASVASAALAFVLSPLGLVLTAIAGLGTYLVWASGVGGEALTWLGQRFDELKGFALESFQGIQDALAAGDLALAARVLWLSLQVVWRAGINTLMGWWLDFKHWYLSQTSGLFTGAVVLATNAWFGLRRVWATTVNFWADLLGKFASFFVRTWNDLGGFVAKQWTKALAVIDPTINVEAVNKRIDRDTKQRNLAVSNRTLDERLDREQELQDLESSRQRTLVDIAATADAEDQTRREQSEHQRQDGQDALEAAREEWRLAVEEAKAKRERARSDSSPEAPTPPAPPEPPSLGDLKQELAAVAPEVEAQVKLTFDVSGGFSAAAADRIGVGESVQERAAKAAEETAKHTRKIAQRMDQNDGLVFA